MRLTPVAHLGLAFSLVLCALATVGCNARQEGDFYVEGSRAMVGSFYAEVFDTERKRWYLLSTQESYDAFKAGSREMPMSKSLIGAGPEKTTVVVEQVKDAEQSQIIGKRLTKVFNSRKGTTITAFDPK